MATAQTKTSVSLEDARRIIAAAEKKGAGDRPAYEHCRGR